MTKGPSSQLKNPQSWEYTHVTLSPKYPQSNGLAESTVHTVKAILDEAKESKTPPLLSILEYRNAPVDELTSPTQLLIGRQLPSVLLVSAY